MGNRSLHARFLPYAEKYLHTLSTPEQALVMSDVNDMKNGDFAIVHIKKLRGPIQEIIVGHHRFTYFQLDSTLYFVRGFRKKSTKTPPQEIAYAESIYKIIKSKV